MSKKLLRKLEERDGIDRVIGQLNSFAIRNTRVAQGVITTIFSGLVVKFAINPDLDKTMNIELIRISFILGFLILFIILDHRSRRYQTLDDMDENSAIHLDTLQQNFNTWMLNKITTIENNDEVIRLFENGAKVFGVMTTKDVKDTYSKGIMMLNELWINTFGDNTKQTKRDKLRKKFRIPSINKKPIPITEEDIESEEDIQDILSKALSPKETPPSPTE